MTLLAAAGSRLPLFLFIFMFIYSFFRKSLAADSGDCPASFL